MAILVYIECQTQEGKQTIVDASWAAINAAKAIGHAIHAVIIGQGVRELASDIATAKGVEKVYCLDDVFFEYPLAERIAPFMFSLVQENDYQHIVAGATGVGKNILPRLAAMLDVMQVSEVTKIIDEKTFEHFIYAGSVIETLESQQTRQVLTVRTTHFDKTCDEQSPVELVVLSVNERLKQSGALSQCDDVNNNTSDDAPDLSTASVVVAGGGGIATAAEFDSLIKPLASQLKAAIGASKIPVANGFCGSECLVGQTGKAIAPALYIAVGISGANQHVSGMKDAVSVIVINNDETAPLFNYADYGLVGDAKTVLPELLANLQA